MRIVEVYVSTKPRYLGTQLGDDRSISQVAKRFMGTGMLLPEEPEPTTTAPANAPPPAGGIVGAGPPLPPPPPGFRKAARTPPLSTAAAIITTTTTARLEAALVECRTNAGAADRLLRSLQLLRSSLSRPGFTTGGAEPLPANRGQHRVQKSDLFQIGGKVFQCICRQKLLTLRNF